MSHSMLTQWMAGALRQSSWSRESDIAGLTLSRFDRQRASNLIQSSADNDTTALRAKHLLKQMKQGGRGAESGICGQDRRAVSGLEPHRELPPWSSWSLARTALAGLRGAGWRPDAAASRLLSSHFETYTNTHTLIDKNLCARAHGAQHLSVAPKHFCDHRLEFNVASWVMKSAHLIKQVKFQLR